MTKNERVDQIKGLLMDSYGVFCDRNNIDEYIIGRMTKEQYADLYDAVVDYINDSF